MGLMPESCREYLLEEAGFLAEMSCMFWNAEAGELRGIYVPEVSSMTGEEWVKTAARNLLEAAVEAKWPEDQVASCYRFYLGEAATEEQEEPEEEIGWSIVKPAEELTAADAYPFPEISWNEPEKPYEKGWQWFRARFGRQGTAMPGPGR